MTSMERYVSSQEFVSIKTQSSKARNISYWSAAYCLFVAVMGLNMVTPIYALYRVEWELTSAMLTLAFSAYAVVVIPTIILVGQLSDRGGYHRFLVPGSILAIAGTTCLYFANGYGMLLTARVLQGLSVGMLNGVVVSMLTKLHPKRDHRRAAILGAAAVTVGNGLGPLTAGLLAQFGPMPMRLPFLVHIALFLPGVIGLIFSRANLPAFNQQMIHLPKISRNLRGPFLVAGLSSFVAWGITGLFMSVIPMYMEAWIERSGPVWSGTVVAAVLMFSGIAQNMTKRWPLQRTAGFGFVMIGAGLAALVFTIHHPSIGMLVVAVLFVGTGYGPLYAGSLALANEIAPEQSRGDIIASFYVCTYLGVILPVWGLGFMTESIGIQSAFDIFAGVLGALVLTGAAGWLMLFGGCNGKTVRQSDPGRRKACGSEINKFGGECP